MSVAEAYENGRGILWDEVQVRVTREISQDVRTCYEDSKAESGKHNTFHGIMCEFSLTKSLVADKTRYYKTYGEKEEICSSTTCYSEMLLAIDCEVVAQHSPAETEETDVYGKKPSSHEEETVEREFEFHPVLWLLILDIKCVGVHKTYTCYDEEFIFQKLNCLFGNVCDCALADVVNSN